MTDTRIPEHMDAVVYRGPGEVEVTQVAVPPLGPREVLVRVAYCGVCGTDLHMLSGDGGYAVPGSVYGHEWSGEVVAVGADATRWSPGDRVVGARRTCGTCMFCASGRPSLCSNLVIDLAPTSGGFSEYLKRDEDALLAVGAAMDLRAAALTEPLAVALHAVNCSGVGAADRVLITGGGPIGILTLAALLARGVSRVVVSEPFPSRQAKVRELGGTAVAPSELPEIKGYVDLSPEPFDAAIECSGSAAATQQALSQLRPGGRLVIVGSNFLPVTLDLPRLLFYELEIVGSREYDPDGFEQALALLGQGTFPWSAIIEEHHSTFEDFMPLVDRMLHGEVAGKPLVVSRSQWRSSTDA
ncbi:MAG: alcohol dehydrogenase catalytic domain-containing protein [Acidimicrobiaceae bacterium]|nr:alcohol dehydrogenase catalytic domain-containing protein [Acidimicrobiaceae bacterium]